MKLETEMEAASLRGHARRLALSVLARAAVRRHRDRRHQRGERERGARMTPAKTGRRGGYEGAAMTFEEIGRHLGITGAGAFVLYQSAIRKIQRQKREVEKLRALVDFRARKEV